MSHRSTGRFQLLVVVWLSLAVGGILLSVTNWSQLSRQIRATERRLEMQQALTDILNQMLLAESSQSGYALTRRPGLQTRYRESRTTLLEQFDRLLELSSDQPNELQEIMDLRGRMAVVLDRFDEVIRNTDLNSTNVVEVLTASGEAGEKSEAFRSDIERILVGSRDDIAGAKSRTLSQLLKAGVSMLVVGLLGITAGVLALWSLSAQIRQRDRERELIEARQEAEHQSKEKTVFLTNMSHEIRTPLNAILGFTELLEADLHDPRQQQYLRSIRTSSQALLQIISDILDMSKIEAGVMELHLEPTDPTELCDFIQTVFAELAARKGLELDCNVARDVPRSLFLDRVRLRQILINLVGNAVKFTDQGHVRVRVRAQPDGTAGSHVTLGVEVEDTGIGIPQDRLERIFQPFAQAGADETKEQQGTGLGLAIARRLTEAMGGTLTATSTLHKGSRLEMRFPHTEISAQLPVTDQPPEDTQLDLDQLRPSRLLIVDDNAENRSLLEGMLSHSHHTCGFAHNGQDGVDMARSWNPDLVLMDIRMPGMDGRQALEAIKQSPGLELLPVIAVTASSAKNEEDNLRELFDGYLRKPFTQRELIRALALFLRREVADGDSSPAGVERFVASSEESLPPVSLSPPPRELVEWLGQCELQRWPALRDNPGTHACGSFARELHEASQRWPCEALAQYAAMLKQAVQAYDVSRMEKVLAAFPELIQRLKQAGSHPKPNPG